MLTSPPRVAYERPLPLKEDGSLESLSQVPSPCLFTRKLFSMRDFDYVNERNRDRCAVLMNVTAIGMCKVIYESYCGRLQKIYIDLTW